MAVTARTWVEGEVGSAAKLNTLRDDILALWGRAIFNLAITPTGISGTVDNWNPTGLAAANRIRVSAASGTDLTGLVAGADGQTLLMQNVGSFALTVHHQSTGSTAANRLVTPTAANLTWNPGTMQQWIYDASTPRWWIGVLS